MAGSPCSVLRRRSRTPGLVEVGDWLSESSSVWYPRFLGVFDTGRACVGDPEVALLSVSAAGLVELVTEVNKVWFLKLTLH